MIIGAFTGPLLVTFVIVLFILMIVLSFVRCGNDDSNCDGLRATYGEASQEYRNCLNSNRSSGRTGGGSFGGFSSGGGGHK